VIVLAIYFTVVTGTILIAGKYLFLLPFDRETPFFLPDNSPTNKTTLFTMCFQTIFLTLLTNFVLLKFCRRYDTENFDSPSWTLRWRLYV